MSELPFEKPIFELERKIEELAGLSDPAHEPEIGNLRAQLLEVRKSIYGALDPWQKTLVARHPLRPYTLDFVRELTTDFVELHGDRRFSDDKAIVAGFGRFRGQPVAVIGHEKGRQTR